MGKLSYHRSAERPSLQLWLLDDDGTLIDFSTGFTFTVKIGNRGSDALLTKTTGITGAAGSGVAPTGEPNVTIAWVAGELNLEPGSYTLQLTATTGTLDRVFSVVLYILETVS